MDIALTLVRLRDEQVGDVAADVVLVADGVAAEDLLESVFVHFVPVSFTVTNNKPARPERGKGREEKEKEKENPTSSHSPTRDRNSSS